MQKPVKARAWLCHTLHAFQTASFCLHIQVTVGTISFVQTKRNRTHGTQMPPETFQTALAVIKAAAFVHTIMPQKARRTPLRLIQIVSLYDKSM